MAIALSLATCVSTLLGGLFALHLSDRLHLILGFSAGALIGVAFFDLIPEALNLANAAGQEAVTATIAAGFVCYMLLDRTVAPHGDKGARTENLWRRGVLGASSLAAHSFPRRTCNWSRLQGLDRGWRSRCCGSGSRLFRRHQHRRRNSS